MAKQGIEKQIIIAPLSGKVTPLENVPDPTFSEKMMGDGLAIEPTDGKIVSPVNGEVVVTFPTKHAIGLKTESGVELLIHVGIETVHMDGEGFEVHVKQGQHVKAGDSLITFDLQLIKKKLQVILHRSSLQMETPLRIMEKRVMIPLSPENPHSLS